LGVGQMRVRRGRWSGPRPIRAYVERATAASAAAGKTRPTSRPCRLP
jgi:hypothetical protein